MNHQMLMSVVDREADEPKQFETLADVQPAFAAVDVDGRTIDILHRDVRPAVLAGAAIDQPRDVGMVEGCENPALVLEAAEQNRVRRPANDLERGPLTKLLADALGEIHRSHATAAEQPHDRPTANRVSWFKGRWQERVGDGALTRGHHERRRLEPLPDSLH